MTKPKHDTQDSDAYSRLTARVADAYESASAKTSDAVHATTSGIDANPVAAIVGGVALGLVAGVLLPRSDKEKELLAPVGERVGEAARAALDAAKASGADALAQSGFGKDQLREQAGKLFQNVVKAAGSAGTAAASAARDSAKN